MKTLKKLSFVLCLLSLSISIKSQVLQEEIHQGDLLFEMTQNSAPTFFVDHYSYNVNSDFNYKGHIELGVYEKIDFSLPFGRVSVNGGDFSIFISKEDFQWFIGRDEPHKSNGFYEFQIPVMGNPIWGGGDVYYPLVSRIGLLRVIFINK